MTNSSSLHHRPGRGRAHRIHTVLTDNGIPFRLPPRYADDPTARFIPICSVRCRENGIEPSLDQRSTGIIVEFSPVSLLAGTNLSTLFVVHPKAIKACQQPWSEPALSCQLQGRNLFPGSGVRD